jgi:hypothetical protein
MCASSPSSKFAEPAIAAAIVALAEGVAQRETALDLQGQLRRTYRNFRSPMPDGCIELKKSSLLGMSKADWKIKGGRGLADLQKQFSLEIAYFLHR